MLDPLTRHKVLGMDVIQQDQVKETMVYAPLVTTSKVHR